MGVHRLWQILNLFRRPYPYIIPRRRIVFIDAFNVIYAYSQNYTNDNFHIAGVYRLAVKMMVNGLVPVFIFDNQSSSLKRQTQLARKLSQYKLIDEDEVDIDNVNQQQFYQFDTQEQTILSAKDQVQEFKKQLDNILHPQNKSINDQGYYSSLNYHDAIQYVPSYAAYYESYKQLFKADSDFTHINAEISEFSQQQLLLFHNQHRTRQKVDFSTQRLQLLFTANAQTNDDEFDLNKQFQPVDEVAHLEPIKLQSQYASTNDGEDVSLLLNNMNIAINRSDIERSIMQFNLSTSETFASKKLSLSEQFSYSPKLTALKIQQCKQLLQMMTLPYFTAALGIEAEQLAASLTIQDYGDYVFSKDSDSIVFGATNVLQFDEDRLTIISAQALQSQNLSKYALLFIALILGGDFNIGLKNVGEVGALEFLAHFGPVMSQRELIDAVANCCQFLKTGETFQSAFTTKLQKYRQKCIAESSIISIVEQFNNTDAIELYLNGKALENQLQSEEQDVKVLREINKKYLQFLAGYCDTSINLAEYLSHFNVEQEGNLCELVNHVLKQEQANSSKIDMHFAKRQSYNSQNASERVKIAMSAITK